MIGNPRQPAQSDVAVELVVVVSGDHHDPDWFVARGAQAVHKRRRAFHEPGRRLIHQVATDHQEIRTDLGDDLTHAFFQAFADAGTKMKV